ncbi:MAG: nucleotidyltransferase domain-containing protein [Planctomycetes bacterium]|nr:nucleotidyltransferase domain-containing protein [Planctomycetota bacterium]
MVRRQKRPLPASVRAALDELKEALAAVYGERFRGLYLYGSFARGTATADSDVDVLIALEGDPRPYTELDRLSPLLGDLCLKHDVLIASYPVPQSWLQERRDPLFESIRREGVLV